MKIKTVFGGKFVIALAVCVAMAQAKEWTIPSPNDGNEAAVVALTNALRQCGTKDVITLSKGVYDLTGVISQSTEDLGASHLLSAAKLITLRGDPEVDREEVILKGDGTARILRLGLSGCWVENITFTNGYASAEYGGAIGAYIPNRGLAAYVSNCVFRCNVSKGDGGASTGVTMYNCLAEYNVSTNGGGALAYGVAYDTTFRNNCAKNGGAVSHTEVVRCLFEGNTSGDDGGAAYYHCAATDCVFKYNIASRYGGACYYCTAMTNNIFIGNIADTHGAALGAQKSVVKNCYFESNWVTGSGSQGVILGLSGSNISVIDCVFTNNAAGWSTSVGSEVAVWSNCTFVANHMRNRQSGKIAGASGGTFYNCTFRDHWSASSEYYSVPPTNDYPRSLGWVPMLSVVRATLYDCSIQGVVSNCVMTRCEIFGCTNSPVVIAGKSVLTNCLVVGNVLASDVNMSPKGMFYGDEGIELVNCTVVDNKGTLFCMQGKDVVNSLFYGNKSLDGTTDQDISTGGSYSDPITFDHCLYKTSTSTTAEFTDCVQLTGSATPRFNYDASQQYPYYMPYVSSMAAGAGKVFDWPDGAVDLGGYPRVRDSYVDIGCYGAYLSDPALLIIFR